MTVPDRVCDREHALGLDLQVLKDSEAGRVREDSRELRLLREACRRRRAASQRRERAAAHYYSPGQAAEQQQQCYHARHGE